MKERTLKYEADLSRNLCLILIVIALVHQSSRLYSQSLSELLGPEFTIGDVGRQMSSPFAVVVDNRIMGTASLISESGVVFMVSARHVLQPAFADTAAVAVQFYNVRPDGRTKQSTFTFPRNPLLLFNHDSADVAAVPIGFENDGSGSSSSIFPGVLAAGLSQDFPVVIGSEDRSLLDSDIRFGVTATTIGFPQELIASQGSFKNPLVRKGTIAGWTSDNSRLVVGIPVYGGNSGGPVYQEALGFGGEDLYRYQVDFVGIAVSFVASRPRELSFSTMTDHPDGIVRKPVLNSGYTLVETNETIRAFLREVAPQVRSMIPPAENQVD